MPTRGIPKDELTRQRSMYPSQYGQPGPMDEMLHSLRLCLTQKLSAARSIRLMREVANFGPTTWDGVDPRRHFFTDFPAALANALLYVENDALQELEMAQVQLSDLLIAVSRRVASNPDYLYCYRVSVGVADGCSYCRVQDGIAAALDDLRAANGEPPLF